MEERERERERAGSEKENFGPKSFRVKSQGSLSLADEMRAAEMRFEEAAFTLDPSKVLL